MTQVSTFAASASPLNMVGLKNELEAMFLAVASENRGATAPTSPFEGMLWQDSSTTPTEYLKKYTVTYGWVTLASINITTGAYIPYRSGSPLTTAAVAALGTGTGNVLTANLASAKVDTITALRAITPFSGQSMQPLGYTTIADGGGGPVRIAKTAPVGGLTDDGGAYIKPGGAVGDAIAAGALYWGWAESIRVINVRWFGAVGDGTSDDYLPINRAITYAKSLISGTIRIATDNGVTVKLDGNHRITAPINLTNIKGGMNFVFDGQGATIYAKTTAKQGIDMMGSNRLTLRDFSMWADLADNVYYGITLGRVTTAVAMDHTFERVRIQGYYTKACLYNLASEQCVFWHCLLFNDYDGTPATAYCMINDSYNSFGVTSDYATELASLAVDTNNSFNANQYYGCSFYRRSFDGNDTVTIPIYMDQNCQMHHYQSCYAVAGRTAAVKIAYRDSATGGWDTLNGLHLDIHIEKYGSASDLSYAIQFVSDSGTLDAVAHDLFYHDNNPHVSAAIFNVSNMPTLTLINTNISVIQTTTGTPVLCLPQTAISYIGKIAIPASMGIQTFGGAFGDIDLIVRDSTKAIVNGIITAAGANVSVRMHNGENNWVVNKQDYPTDADLANTPTGAIYKDTSAGNVLKIK